MTSQGAPREDPRALTHDRPRARDPDPAQVPAVVGEFGSELGIRGADR